MIVEVDYPMQEAERTLPVVVTLAPRYSRSNGTGPAITHCGTGLAKGWNGRAVCIAIALWRRL